MGCSLSTCWPGRREEQPPEKPGMRGFVIGELGRWRTSIELLEKEGKKQAERDQQTPQISAQVAATATPGVAERLGLAQSYRQLKDRLFGGAQKPADGSPQSGAAETEVSQSGSSASAWRRKRSSLLETMSSGELMISTDPAVLRAKLLAPPRERERQETVDALKVVGSPQNEAHYASIATLAAKIFKTPYAAIEIISGERVWVKAVHSSQGPELESSRESSLTSYMLLSGKREVMVVEDTREDGRFHDIATMTKAKKRTRFFAAAPLYASNGYQIGALTITDTKPRKLDAGSFSLLTNLAEMVIRALEKDAFGVAEALASLPPPASGETATATPPPNGTVSGLDLQLVSELGDGKLQARPAAPATADKQQLLRSATMLETGIMVCGTTGGGGVEVLHVSSVWTQLTGVAPQDACSKGLWQLFSVPGRQVETVTRDLEEAVSNQRTLAVSARLEGVKGYNFELSFKSAAADILDTDMPLVGVPSYVEFSRQRDLRYFFVTVRKARDLGCHKLPASAFEDAAGFEPWGPPAGDAEPEADPAPATPNGSVEGGTEEQAADQLPEGSGRGANMRRKASVALPYNDDLFAKVTLGPLLGRGSFGTVHRGVWDDRDIAVKIIEDFKEGEPDGEVDDLPEAVLMEAMRHPNVMLTFKHATRAKHAGSAHLRNFRGGPATGGYMLETWLLLEFCNKGSLQDAIDRGWFRTEPSRAKGKPALGIILPTALELARGLEYLHSRDVLHGDLSPGNVLLHNCAEAPHGFTVKIADFGLSRSMAGGIGSAIKTQTFGTVTHMPPELLMEGKLTKAADVYAFGVLLWGMYTGVPPWQGMRRTQVLFKVTALGATLQIPPACPPFLKDILQRCMQRDYKERPTFSALVRELEVLAAAAGRGDDMQSYPSLATQRRMRSVSMPKPALPGVLESEPLAASELRKTAPCARGYRKAISLQRRPSFSQKTRLEVV